MQKVSMSICCVVIFIGLLRHLAFHEKTAVRKERPPKPHAGAHSLQKSRFLLKHGKQERFPSHSAAAPLQHHRCAMPAGLRPDGHGLHTS